MQRRKPRKAKKFRFQFVALWLINNYLPYKVADIGGGKGLFSYLLNASGWQSTVIDPVYQDLPEKYKDILTKKRVKIDESEKVPLLTKEFDEKDVKEFDLLVGVHAHGSNMQIIDAAKKFDKDFLLLPCCVIDEPIEKRPGVNWRKSLKKYAEDQGFEVKEIAFNFVGKSYAIYTDKFLKRKKDVDQALNSFLVQGVVKT